MKQTRFFALTTLVYLALFLPGAFGHHRTGTLALPELIVVGDFNQDGNLDLAVNVTGFDMVALFSGDGLGGLTLTGHILSDTLPEGLAVGDVNRDGHLDLVTVNQWGYDIMVHSGDGLGGFSRYKEMNGEGEGNRGLLGDINNDGWLDIVANAPKEDKILLYLSNGKGGFISEDIELTGFHAPSDIAAADLNKDGKLDLVVLNTDRGTEFNEASILLGDGKGGFTTSSQLPLSTGSTTVRITDLNGDGNLDLIVVGALPTNSTGNFVSTFLGDGTGQFTLSQTTPLSGLEISGGIAVADFNEDGKPDVAIPNLTEVLLLFGDGNGGLVAQDSLLPGTSAQTAFPADFNKDGHIDLAVSLRTVGNITLLLGDGAGNFTASTTVSVVCTTCLEDTPSIPEPNQHSSKKSENKSRLQTSED